MIKVKLLHKGAKVPSRTNPTDAGLDLCAIDTGRIEGVWRKVVDTGVAISIPDGYVGRILPRSGLAAKEGIQVMAGVIDSSYRGEIKVVLFNSAPGGFIYRAGDRIAQLVIQKVELWTPVVVDELDDTTRGENGFGSSGN